MAKTRQGLTERHKDFNRSISEHRDRLMLAQPLATPAEIPFYDVLNPLNSNAKSLARIYRPKISEKLYPTIFYVPGTAFVANEIAFTHVICSHLAEKTNCQVIVIHHVLAPEHQFPEGLIDAYSIFKGFMIAPESFHIDTTKTALLGYSSGGNFAASMSLIAKDDNLPLARQLLISPVVDLSRSLNDFKENFEEKDKVITEKFVQWFLNLYIPTNQNPKNPWLSPFFQKQERLKKLPPTDIIFAEYDRFRSDAQKFYEKLLKSGVPSETLMINGENHSFLWYKLEVVETLARRLKFLFNINLYNDSFSKSHMLFFVRPRLFLKKQDDDENKNSLKLKL